MRILRTGLVLTALLTLAACASPQEEAEQMAAQQQADEAECRKIGFAEGTEAFSDCLLRLREIRAQQENTDELRRARTPSPWWGPYPGRYPYYPYNYW